MTGLTEGNEPVSAPVHAITASPVGITLDRWREMYLVYTEKWQNDSAQAAREWNDATRFLNTPMTAEEYYANPTFCENVEAVFAALCTKKFKDCHEDMVAVLHGCVDKAREGKSGHWRELAENPDVAMYLDMARLMSRKILYDMKHRRAYGRYFRPLAAEIDTKLDDAFNEAFLAPNFDKGKFPRFLEGVLNARLIDFYRSHFGAEGQRPKTRSLKKRDLRRAGTEEKLLLQGDHIELWEHFKASLAQLPEKTKRVFFTFIEAKAFGNEEVTQDEVMQQLDIGRTQFNYRMKHARDHLARANPEYVNYAGRKEEEAGEINENMIALKAQLRYLFMHDDGNFSAIRLSEETGIEYSGLSRIFSKTDNNPRSTLSDHIFGTLSDTLKRMGREDRIPEFTRLFEELRRESGYGKWAKAVNGYESPQKQRE